MKQSVTIVLIVIVIVVAATILFLRAPKKAMVPTPLTVPHMIQVTSSAFSHNGAIPPKYTCDGENVSPPLAIAGIPDEAKSLVLIMDDPDAPAGTWTHWTVWNINPMVSEIEEGSVPVGAGEGTTSFGKPGYGGPCPPSGTHRYFFKIFALDTMLDLAPGASRNELEKAIEERILDQGEIVGHYSR